MAAQDKGEMNVWSWDWRFSVSAVLLLGAIAYSLGWAHLRQRGHRLVRASRPLTYLAGLLVIAVALMSPIDRLQAWLFAIHMLQHQLLMYLAPPLLLAARPLPFILWGMPGPARRGLGLLLIPASPARRGLTLLTKPAVAFVLSTAILWLWHIPAAYDLALENGIVHDLEHLSFFGAFLVYWWPLIGSPPQPARLATNAARGLYLVAGAMQSALLGGLIAFADQVLYPHYLAAPRLGGLSALADQRLAGALMWFPGPLIYGLAAMLIMTEEGENDLRRIGRAATSHPVPLNR